MEYRRDNEINITEETTAEFSLPMDNGGIDAYRVTMLYAVTGMWVYDSPPEFNIDSVKYEKIEVVNGGGYEEISKEELFDSLTDNEWCDFRDICEDRCITDFEEKARQL